MVAVTIHGTVEPFCCWLRPAPKININLHCTFDKILEAVNLQQWYPINCHYCSYQPKHQDDYERHVVNRHPHKAAYPGPCPENAAKALYIVQSIENELEKRRKLKLKTKTKSKAVPTSKKEV
jgi:hypothetical protein